MVQTDVADGHAVPVLLEDQEIKELVSLAKLIESHYGRPMDIEWAIDKDFPFPENIFIVQARPETVWSQKEDGSCDRAKRAVIRLLMEQA